MRLLVTVGTDGFVDWVKLPNGQKLLLGALSVLNFVSKLTKNKKAARSTLDLFLQDGEAMLTVDEERMWTLLAPRRARWSSTTGEQPLGELVSGGTSRVPHNCGSGEISATPKFAARANSKELAEAKALGAAAFKKGITAPALDKDLKPLLANRQMGESTPILKAWVSGWTKANIADSSWKEASSNNGLLMANNSHTRKATMIKDLTGLELHIQALNKAAALGTVPKEKMAEGTAILTKLASKVQAGEMPDFIKDKIEEKKEDEDKGEDKKEDKKASLPKLALDVYQANTTLANQILAKTEETASKIAQLVTAGKKFNAATARLDVHQVTSKVAAILRTDLTQSWVEGDLQKLASRADQLHGLFFSHQ